jgi:LacI family transcriptional regulator
MKKFPRVALLIESSRTYGRELIRGITEYSRVNGPWLFPWVFHKQNFFYIVRGMEHAVLEDLKKWHPDGIITRDSKGIEKLKKWNIPMFVSVGMQAPDYRFNNIIPDDQAIGRMAAEHLLERGFRNFGFCGFDEMYWSRQRCESFRGRIAKAGFQTSIYKQPKSYISSTWYREEINLMRWLKGLPKPVGIMTCNDDRAQHVTSACINAKVDVPYEVAVVGVDNDEQVCVVSNPPLSSVALDVKKAGFHTSELLGKMMAGKKLSPQRVYVHPIKVVTRQSTDIVAIEDKLVAQALNFINQNAERPLQIHDVAKEVRFSRSHLHQKFMSTLNRSVYDEIRRARINIISRLLLETDLSVSDIAIKLGFSSDSHIARYFKQRTGMSPLKYRKLIGHQ